jgi:hypothetical protein
VAWCTLPRIYSALMPLLQLVQSSVARASARALPKAKKRGTRRKAGVAEASQPIVQDNSEASPKGSQMGGGKKDNLEVHDPT